MDLDRLGLYFVCGINDAEFYGLSGTPQEVRCGKV